MLLCRRGGLPITSFSVASASVETPACSADIKNAEETKQYYREKLVGDHEIQVGGAVLVIRFAREEIHAFTEDIQEGNTPPPEKLVQRPKSSEVRVFSLTRARLLDSILPTLSNAAGAVAAKEPRSTLVFGPSDKEGKRIAVVIYPVEHCFAVRTAYPLTPKEFAHYRRTSKSRPWPPKY